MDNLAIELKINERINKLDSNDYNNIDKWKVVEIFNKGMVDWCRRTLHGANQSRTGDEQSKRRKDDLQVLLRDFDLTPVKKELHYVSSLWPADYFEYKRVSITGTTECCKANKGWTITLVEEGNIDIILTDHNRKPNFEWRSTVVTLMNNTVKIWTNDEFEVPKATLTYYKQPRRIEIQGVSNPYNGGALSTTEVICEFKDDIVELFIEEAVKIISGDIEYLQSFQIADKSVESNN
jgi:hypothetical protein